MNDFQGELRGDLHASQEGLSGSSSLRSDGSRDSRDREADCVSVGQNQLKGGHQAQVHSDQMVLVMARQEGWTQ
jgi:hypothetical protein